METKTAESQDTMVVNVCGKSEKLKDHGLAAFWGLYGTQRKVKTNMRLPIASCTC